MRNRGIGYYYKNWGDVPFASVMQKWYWGYAIIGPYTLVWFDAMHRDDRRYTSGCVSRTGIVQLASCMQGRQSVRPWGANSTYPPTDTTGRAQGLEVVYTLDDGNVLAVNVKTETPQIEFETTLVTSLR
ncbi:hypothetical protein DE146DRAFT_778100 [Phaeosphaeria sp. MPI-PUGE-AT-0046c]|nr:hypothetical protein DE146DRAFT_778100 [Phaeosphaeria sp. MPI-PUGE-AT-0046c]